MESRNTYHPMALDNCRAWLEGYTRNLETASQQTQIPEVSLSFRVFVLPPCDPAGQLSAQYPTAFNCLEFGPFREQLNLHVIAVP